MKRAEVYQFTRDELVEAIRLGIVDERTHIDRYLSNEEKAGLSAVEHSERQADLLLDLMENGREALGREH